MDIAKSALGEALRKKSIAISLGTTRTNLGNLNVAEEIVMLLKKRPISRVRQVQRLVNEYSVLQNLVVS